MEFAGQEDSARARAHVPAQSAFRQTEPPIGVPHNIITPDISVSYTQEKPKKTVLAEAPKAAAQAQEPAPDPLIAMSAGVALFMRIARRKRTHACQPIRGPA